MRRDQTCTNVCIEPAALCVDAHACAGNEGRMLFDVLFASDKTCKKIVGPLAICMAKALYMYMALHVMFQLII